MLAVFCAALFSAVCDGSGLPRHDSPAAAAQHRGLRAGAARVPRFLHHLDYPPHLSFLQDGIETMKKYLIVIETTPTGFSAYSPNLPGCVSTGETREEIKSTMRDPLAFPLAGFPQQLHLLPN